MADGRRDLEQEQQRHHSRADDDRHAERVDEVLDGDAGERRHQGHARADERRLDRLADEEPQRRQVAERVAGDEGRERVADPKWRSASVATTQA